MDVAVGIHDVGPGLEPQAEGNVLRTAAGVRDGRRRVTSVPAVTNSKKRIAEARRADLQDS